MEVIIPLLDIVINSALVALYFVLAYLFYQGLAYAKNEGKLMLKAIALFFFVASAHSVVNVFIAMQRIYNEVYINPVLTYDYLAVTITEFLLAIAALYLLYATIKRNPPKVQTLNNLKNNETEVTKK
jgi:hypothetical protein